MISFKIKVNPNSLGKKIERTEERLDKFVNYFIHGLINEAVILSPVDTGTYVTSWHFGTSPASGSESSHGKPRHQDWSQKMQEGLNQVVAEVDAIGSLREHPKYYLSNTAAHSYQVEYEHGYAVFTAVANKANIIAAEAAQRAKE